MALIENKDVIQSYIMTTAKYDYNVYEKRILYRLVEMFQSILQGKKLNKGFRVDKTLFDDRVITMPISSFLVDEKDQNHTRVKDALTRLRNKTFEYDDGKVWKLIGIIEKPRFDINGVVNFELQSEVFEAIFSFSKGYRKYELKTAMQFKSIYSMRFYELMSNQQQPLIFTIQQLKEMFLIQDKYKKVNDFIKRVIEPAKKELDEKSPYTFDYEMIKQGRSYYAVKLFPIAQPQHRDEALERTNLEKQIAPGLFLGREVKQYLIHSFGFTNDEIKRNLTLFKNANEQLDFINFMSIVKERTITVRNPKGYLINAIKSELKK